MNYSWFVYLIVYLLIVYALSSTNVVSLDHSKIRGLEYLPNNYTFRHMEGSPEKIKSLLNNQTKFPLIIKPNICSGRGNGVKKVKGLSEAIEYLNNTKVCSLLVEEYSTLPYECGILYIRLPWNKNGIIRSMTQKVLVKENKVNYNISTSKLVNINHLITPKLYNVINDLSKRIPGFHYGRYDIKYNSESDLQNGIFKVIEVNGVLSCDLNFYVGGTKFSSFLVEPICGPHLMLARIVIGSWNILNLRNYPTILFERLQELQDLFHCRQWKMIGLLLMGYFVFLKFVGSRICLPFTMLYNSTGLAVNI